MKKYLIITTALTTICFAPEIMAQCTENTDCASLGYTETSCPDGGLKCPLGNYWYCPAEQCSADYQYTCTGTGYAGGSGEACDGKYKSCTCADGYEWKNGACQKKPAEQAEWGKCNGYAQNCNIGDIVYSDGTCNTPSLSSGKTPIAVVIYKSDDGNCAQAMTLNSIGNYNWKESSERYIDLSLKNFTSTQTASTDFQSCTNTVIITAAGDKSQYPAAWAAKEYSTEGTKAGDWCLPAAGIMTSIKNNIDLINSKYIQITGRTINKDTYLWTSSEYSNYYAWASNFNTDYGLGNYGHYGMHSNLEVRPVIEF